MNGFRDRTQAGQELARALTDYAAANPLVLALPRGGVPVGYEVAKALHAPLDVWVVRKIGVPWHTELGVGAVAQGGFVYLDESMMRYVGLSRAELEDAIDGKKREVEARARRFGAGHRAPQIAGRTIILVDDGIATGGTMRAAIQTIRAQHPQAIVVAVPVASPEVVDALNLEVERVICLKTPVDLRAIGLWYSDFAQVPDEVVIATLERARADYEGVHHAVA